MASAALDAVLAALIFVGVGVPAAVIGWRVRKRREANRPLPKSEELYRKWLVSNDPKDLDAYTEAMLKDEREQN